MNKYKFTPALQKILGDELYSKDEVGLSCSEIFLFSDKVLKIRDDTEETESEITMLQWLKGKLPVPECLYHEKVIGTDYLLMSRVCGKMACDPEIMSNPRALTISIAKCLNQLWSVDISQCPCRWDLDRKLSAAYKAIQNNEVEVENAESGTYSSDGFRNPMELYNWLVENRPDEDLVLSHGDFCLPNIFLYNGELSGLVDLGRTGTADRWQDIALCYRSLKHNYNGKYGGTIYENYDPNMLFDCLGLDPDWGKLNYYILLDELF